MPFDHRLARYQRDVVEVEDAQRKLELGAAGFGHECHAWCTCGVVDSDRRLPEAVLSAVV